MKEWPDLGRQLGQKRPVQRRLLMVRGVMPDVEREKVVRRVLDRDRRVVSTRHRQIEVMRIGLPPHHPRDEDVRYDHERDGEARPVREERESDRRLREQFERQLRQERLAASAPLGNANADGVPVDREDAAKGVEPARHRRPRSLVEDRGDVVVRAQEVAVMPSVVVKLPEGGRVAGALGEHGVVQAIEQAPAKDGQVRMVVLGERAERPQVHDADPPGDGEPDRHRPNERDHGQPCRREGDANGPCVGPIPQGTLALQARFGERQSPDANIGRPGRPAQAIVTCERFRGRGRE